MFFEGLGLSRFGFGVYGVLLGAFDGDGRSVDFAVDIAGEFSTEFIDFLARDGLRYGR